MYYRTFKKKEIDQTRLKLNKIITEVYDLIFTTGNYYNNLRNTTLYGKKCINDLL